MNTLSAFAFHINYYNDGILNEFESCDLVIRDKFSFDAPQTPSQAEWDLRLIDLWSNSERLAEQVILMSSDQLEQPFVKESFGTHRRNIESVLDHSYYHLGQVSLIKKMIFEDLMPLALVT